MTQTSDSSMLIDKQSLLKTQFVPEEMAREAGLQVTLKQRKTTHLHRLEQQPLGVDWLQSGLGHFK